ncbi:hypothetical protein FA13DRAFT_1742773 [Coprinellus micaceus]|uniref:Uncharacterized protein n=1 Tax=Coprinellus micaceus TaxID=71717 RepID=A0A4Y7SFH2_COPMI|nr:hypothetical protein FA13DRAFT_1742773 [Coprinellus micaceus]
MEAQYWMHGILQGLSDLRDISSRDSIYSTSPYNLDELECDNVGPYLGAANYALLCANKVNLLDSTTWHGVPEVRTSRDQSVHENGSRSRTWLIKMLSPLLFSAPDVHLRTFGKMWVDCVDIGSTLSGIPSPVQVACYLSIVSSLGGILLGLPPPPTEQDPYSSTFRSHPMLGLEALAILYSLPLHTPFVGNGLRSWWVSRGIAFYATNTKNRAIMVAAWAIFVGLIGWCIVDGLGPFTRIMSRGVVGSGGAVNAEPRTSTKEFYDFGERGRAGSRAHLYPPCITVPYDQ